MNDRTEQPHASLPSGPGPDRPFEELEDYFVAHLGRYTPGCCPEYLKAANFEKLRANVHRIRIHTTTVTDHLRRTDARFSRYVLLDHMDWLRERPEVLGEEWSAISRTLSCPASSWSIKRPSSSGLETSVETAAR